MQTQSKLNLIGVFSPVCLMKCKSTLNTMQPGEQLTVLIADPDVVAELEKIIRRSKDQVIHRVKESDHFSLKIRKG